jgi:hypothetical protein
MALIQVYLYDDSCLNCTAHPQRICASWRDDLIKRPDRNEQLFFMAKVEAVEFESDEATLEGFRQEWLEIVNASGGKK